MFIQSIIYARVAKRAFHFYPNRCSRNATRLFIQSCVTPPLGASRESSILLTERKNNSACKHRKYPADFSWAENSNVLKIFKASLSNYLCITVIYRCNCIIVICFVSGIFQKYYMRKRRENLFNPESFFFLSSVIHFFTLLFYTWCNYTSLSLMKLILKLQSRTEMCFTHYVIARTRWVRYSHDSYYFLRNYVISFLPSRNRK